MVKNKEFEYCSWNQNEWGWNFQNVYGSVGLIENRPISLNSLNEKPPDPPQYKNERRLLETLRFCWSKLSVKFLFLIRISSTVIIDLVQ
jgi:hypothetical protein